MTGHQAASASTRRELSGDEQTLVLRLAGPLQSWGAHSQFNRRHTSGEPTKSGVLGLLAAAQGRRRQDPIEDLLALRLGVRTDQPGSLLRDYHTVSDLRDQPLLSAQVNAKGLQKRTSPAKLTHVTERFYLQDAVFVAALSGPAGLLGALSAALRSPSFPLALGRRACPPTQPILLSPLGGEALWSGGVAEVLGQVAWMASQPARDAWQRNAERDGRAIPATVRLPFTVDDEDGRDVRADVPVSFAPRDRGFTTRRVRQDWAVVPTGLNTGEGEGPIHDPFALLGW